MDRIGEIGDLDAAGQAGLVRRGEVSPLELVNEAIGRIGFWDLMCELGYKCDTRFARYIRDRHGRRMRWGELSSVIRRRKTTTASAPREPACPLLTTAQSLVPFHRLRYC